MSQFHGAEARGSEGIALAAGRPKTQAEESRKAGESWQVNREDQENRVTAKEIVPVFLLRG